GGDHQFIGINRVIQNLVTTGFQAKRPLLLPPRVKNQDDRRPPENGLAFGSATACLPIKPGLFKVENREGRSLCFDELESVRLVIVHPQHKSAPAQERISQAPEEFGVIRKQNAVPGQLIPDMPGNMQGIVKIKGLSPSAAKQVRY